MMMNWKSYSSRAALWALAATGASIACSGEEQKQGATQPADSSEVGGSSAGSSSSATATTPGASSSPSASTSAETDPANTAPVASDGEGPTGETNEPPAQPSASNSGSMDPPDDSNTAEPNDGDPTDGDPADEQTPEPAVEELGFSVPSGTFEGSLSVDITGAADGVEVRYTTDGTLPTATSTLYDGTALSVEETTQLRAQGFDENGAVDDPVTAIYIRRTFDFSSDIPLVIMEAYGAGKPTTEPGPEKVIFHDLAFMLFEPVDGTASISATPTWASRSGYHVRGQSSANFEKTPYRIELWGENDDDFDRPMIGMPADSDWAMVGPYTDKTLIRNAFAYSLGAAMGLAAPELRFAEVYINQDAGPLEASDYEGVYAVTETIKNMGGRLDLKQLRPNDTLESDLSGGYIFKFDMAALREDEGEIAIPCTGEEETCFTDLELTDPVEPNAEQLAWIQNYVQQAHDALIADPIGDYAQYLDVASFVDLIIINELTKGGDKYVRSVYMHKERDGLITAGPVWDYNFTLDNYVSELEGWQVESGRDSGNNWFRILFSQPEFRALAAARWAELRQGLFSDAELEARVDEVAAPLLNAGPRDLERWPVGEDGGFFGGGLGGGGGGADPEEEETAPEDEEPTTWQGQVDSMKAWMRARTAWLDAAYAEF